MEKNRSAIQKLGSAFYWELKKRLYRFRFQLCIWLFTVLLISLLPREICRYLALHASPLVVILNTFCACAFLTGIVILPISSLSAPYGTAAYKKEQISDISAGIRLTARILVSFIQTGVVLILGYLSMGGMDKFADGHTSYFRFSISENPCETFLLFGVLLPLLYLMIFLMRRRRYQTSGYFSSWLLAAILVSAAEHYLERLMSKLAAFPEILTQTIWCLQVLLLSAACFLHCLWLENH